MNNPQMPSLLDESSKNIVGKTLILDCDGVLYPTSQLALKDFVGAMKQTYREDAKIDAQTQKIVSEETIAKNHLGMFNYIKALCDKTGYPFETFCIRMFNRVNYDNITRDNELLNLLQERAQKNKVVIFTNNHMMHLEKVLQKRFGKSVFEMQDLGIDSYDITSTERNGVFYPKHDPQTFPLFAQQLQTDPSQCIMVDDTPRCTQAAQNAHMDAVLINENFTLKDYLKLLSHTNRLIRHKGFENVY